MPSVSSFERQREHGPFGIGAPELVALVACARRRRRPSRDPRTRARRPIRSLRRDRGRDADRTAARSPAGRCDRATRRTRDRRLSTGAIAPGANGIDAHSASGCAVDDARSESSGAPSATARPSTWHSNGAFVRSPLVCAATPANRSSSSASSASIVSVPASIPVETAMREVMSEIQVIPHPAWSDHQCVCELPQMYLTDASLFQLVSGSSG